ncbi:WG containing repeat-containing protein [Selenomonas ruminantium]|uniref:WG containing repeat-containing protein n=1 Tax=Selenomonas ruminantium TaxID=971 RepID=A0A1M6XIH5_SELRU|nr:WG repeat-containing protein [Selenomonas ruminantium]SHL05605.1 WG containing repeat-containing protein [Selenomonas ruminantium]
MRKWKKSLLVMAATMALWGPHSLQAVPLAVVQESNLCGVIDTQGNFRIPLAYDKIVPWSNGALMLKKGELCGVLGQDGQVIVPVEYLNILIPSHGKTYLVENNEAHWGAYSSEGKLLLPVIYDEITAVTKENDCFGVRQGTVWKFVRRDGTPVSAEEFAYIGEFDEDGLVAVKQQDKWGYATANGEIVISCQFDAVQNFSQGLAAIKQQGKWGFVDPQGIIRIKPQYSDVFSGFSEGLAAVQSPQGKGYIDKRGRLLIPRDSRYIGPFQNGVAEIHEVKKKVNVWRSLTYGASIALGGIGLPPNNLLKSNEKRGFISRQGKEIVSTSYDEVLPFADGMALVRKDKKWGAVSMDGRTHIRPRYLAMRPFGSGVSAVRTEAGWQLIDKSGQVVKDLPATVTDAGIMAMGLLPVCIGGKWGYLGKDGELVVAPRFTQVSSFYEMK